MTSVVSSDKRSQGMKYEDDLGVTSRNKDAIQSTAEELMRSFGKNPATLKYGSQKFLRSVVGKEKAKGRTTTEYLDQEFGIDPAITHWTAFLGSSTIVALLIYELLKNRK